MLQINVYEHRYKKYFVKQKKLSFTYYNWFCTCCVLLRVFIERGDEEIFFKFSFFRSFSDFSWKLVKKKKYEQGGGMMWWQIKKLLKWCYAAISFFTVWSICMYVIFKKQVNGERIGNNKKMRKHKNYSETKQILMNHETLKGVRVSWLTKGSLLLTNCTIFTVGSVSSTSTGMSGRCG